MSVPPVALCRVKKRTPSWEGAFCLIPAWVLCLPAHATGLKHESPAPNQEQAYQQDQREAVRHLGEKSTASTSVQSIHGTVTFAPYASAHARHGVHATQLGDAARSRAPARASDAARDRLQPRGPGTADHRRRPFLDRDHAVQLESPRPRREGEGGGPRGGRDAGGG